MEAKMITAIVLTFNEEIHIARCIRSLRRVASRVIVVDSYSTDRTLEIAEAEGAEVLQHPYVNQAQQFQWALDTIELDTPWAMRMDADEYLSDALVDEIKNRLPELPEDVCGVNFKLRVKFLGKEMRWGVARPVRVLRLWRSGSVYMEQKQMDERLVLTSGSAVTFDGFFVNEELKGLSAWTLKHDNYSNREVAQVLGRLPDGSAGETPGMMRKDKSLYYRMPRFFRAFCYFCMRYFLFLGFLDGRRGFIWLVLQAYWYRFLVDAKLYEEEIRSKEKADLK